MKKQFISTGVFCSCFMIYAAHAQDPRHFVAAPLVTTIQPEGIYVQSARPKQLNAATRRFIEIPFFTRKQRVKAV